MTRPALIVLCALIAGFAGPRRQEEATVEADGIRVRAAGRGASREEVVELRTRDGWRAVLRTQGSPVLLTADPAPPGNPREDRVLFDFESEPEKGWRAAEGSLLYAFTRSNRRRFEKKGEGFLGTCEVPGGFDDGQSGVLESPPFTVDREFLTLLVGGGNRPEGCYVALVRRDSGEEVFRVTGHDSETFRLEVRDVKALQGTGAFLRVVDREKGGWGHVNLDHVVLTDRPPREAVPVPLEAEPPSAGMTRLTGGGWTVGRRIGPGPVPGSLHVTVEASGDGRTAGSLEDRLGIALEARPAGHPEGPYDLVWSQHIKRSAEDIIPHWAFKSPAVIVQQGPLWVALVPDLTGVDPAASPAALDLSAQEAWLGCGLVPSAPRYHSGFVRDGTGRVARTSHRYWILAGEAPPREGFRPVVSFLWERYGSPALAASPDLQRNARQEELCLFDRWRDESWQRFAGEVYREFDLDGAPCATLVCQRAKWAFGEGTVEDAWFNSWFQTLRTAYGWHLSGAGERAERILNLALRAPRHNGFFPTIYDLGAKRWWADDGWAGYRESHHTFCMSWTAYWMLRWVERVPGRKEEILGFCRPYGDALLRIQRPSGLIPSWIGRGEFDAYNAETAGSALFLAELSAAAGEPRYLGAAGKAMDFIVRETLPRRRWFDFETFLSCSRKPYDFYDPFTAQFPQNNLSTLQAAMAAARLHRLTGEDRWRNLALRLTDDVALTQQVWNHPGMAPKLVGGMTTQNSDAEWSDARQCYAALVFLEAYDLGGRLEHLERAVGAARATFAVAPWENWAHLGHNDGVGAMTGLHWGTGSAMTSVEMMQPRLGDAYVHVARRHGVGFNACSLRDLAVEGDAISFSLAGVPEWSGKRARVRFEGTESEKTYRVRVNGADAGSFTGRRLEEEGLPVPMP